MVREVTDIEFITDLGGCGVADLSVLFIESDWFDLVLPVRCGLGLFEIVPGDEIVGAECVPITLLPTGLVHLVLVDSEGCLETTSLEDVREVLVLFCPCARGTPHPGDPLFPLLRSLLLLDNEAVDGETEGVDNDDDDREDGDDNDDGDNFGSFKCKSDLDARLGATVNSLILCSASDRLLSGCLVFSVGVNSLGSCLTRLRPEL